MRERARARERERERWMGMGEREEKESGRERASKRVRERARARAYRRMAACMLCQKAHEECGSSWKGELPKETIGHIQSAGCLGQKEVVTAAHNACIRELLQEVNVHAKADRHMPRRLLTI